MTMPIGASSALLESRPRDVRTRLSILDAYIDAVSWDEAVHRIAAWARLPESRCICACNVHSVVTAALDPVFREAINTADLCVPDGMPLVWVLSKVGFPQQRIYGPDLMWRLCEYAALAGHPVFFYGSSSQVVARLRRNLNAAIPGLQIAGVISPPYRPPTEEEDREATECINASGAAIVFVGLGCPKQELWMAQHRGRIRKVMVGVGLGFDLHAGTVRRAPAWMQANGLEWLYRLLREPRRLWRRYLVTNTIFIVRIAAQLLRKGRHAVLLVKAPE